MSLAIDEIALPTPAAWREAAARHSELFAPLTADARIGLIARDAPAEMLVWAITATGVEVRTRPYPGFADCDVDILLAADDEALARIRGASAGNLFREMRTDIRSGSIICYMLSRRCELEVQGFEPLLDALGFVFMGACR